MSSKSSQELTWRQLHWRRPVEAGAVTELLRLWACDPRSPRIILEIRRSGDGLQYLVGVPRHQLTSVTRTLAQTVPGTQLSGHDIKRPSVAAAGSLRLTSAQRPLRSSDPEAAVRAVLGALDRVRRGEQLEVQIVLGLRLSARPVASTAPSKSSDIALRIGSGLEPGAEARTARRQKQSEPGFGCTIRLGVEAGDKARRRSLLASTLAGLRCVEAPGVQLRLVPEPARRLNQVVSPWRWPLTLNVHELTGLVAWPIGKNELPGIPSLHPVLLPPPKHSKLTPERVVGIATAPGFDQAVGLSARDSLRHLWLLGPNGTGKSTLLLNLLVQDIQAGRAVVLVEPKGDLAEALLARIPAHRLDDVVVLDPLDDSPVGLNPLAGHGSSQVRVEGLLAVFRALFADSWGPRTNDILSASLLTLARRGDTTLVMVPLLLTNPGFRRSVTQQVVRADPLALGAFWGWYEALSDAERGAVIAPVMNKLRVFLTNPRLRAVIGQRVPRVDMSQVLRDNKILLVPLRKGTLGAGTARLLGSLVVAELWQAVLSRPPSHVNRPVMVAIDEVQDYLHLPTDLGDALAQARGMGASFTVANQFTDQLPRDIRAGFLGNIRSRVCFQMGAHDARLMADGHPEVSADDLTGLGAFEVYASLVAGHQARPYLSARTLPQPPACSDPKVVRASSREQYGQPLSAIEHDLAGLIQPRPDGAGSPEATSGRRRRSS